jgi:small subunit ribosomal protein S1|tara:strand:- start:65 stop:1393 length:1329 start_codon:yes stop_codon:yes gene_type:complete
MSTKTNQKQKRARLSTTTKLVEANQESEVKVETSLKSPNPEKIKPGPDTDFLDENGEFMWDVFQADCPTKFRKPNPHIKTKNGEKVYSREPYAQELYDLMEGHSASSGTLYALDLGETYTGKVYGIDAEWASIDVGYRELIYVDLSRETPEVRELLKEGVEVDVQLIADTSMNVKKYMIGSVTAGLKTKVVKEIVASIDDGNTAYSGIVSKMIPGGGYIVEVQGVDCFMPGSLAGVNKLHDFESIIDTEMYVVPVSYSEDKGTVVVSHRAYLRALIPNTIKTIQEDITVERLGHVTGSAKYGVFVEFEGCLTGMIHVNDLDTETSKAHRDRSLEPGTEIKFYVKEVINERKITLVQGSPAEKKVDPWEGISLRYNKKTEVVGNVKSTKDYGLFVEIEEGVVGLLHISEFPDNIDIKDISKGADITVQVIRVEEDTRKVFLKL